MGRQSDRVQRTLSSDRNLLILLAGSNYYDIVIFFQDSCGFQSSILDIITYMNEEGFKSLKKV